MSYRVLLAPGAERALRKLPPAIRRQIVPALSSLAETPRPAGCTKLKSVEDCYRIRVGDYRALYAVDDSASVVLVTVLAHRRDAYR